MNTKNNINHENFCLSKSLCDKLSLKAIKAMHETEGRRTLD